MVKKSLKLLRYYFLKKILRTRRDVPIYIFGYHKCGTKLLGKVFLQLSLKYGWEYRSVAGSTDKIPDADVVFFLHSQIDDSKLPEKYIGIHMVRDPRDIIISGYLYHKRTTEEWCVNKNFQTSEPIKYPQVPNSQMYRSQEWKVNYLKSLEGMSYQEKINSLDQDEGIMFEMNHYGKWTIEDMLKWDFDKANCLELKFEDVMSNYDNEMMKVFNHCGFSGEQLQVAKAYADKEDINKMSKKDIEKNPHISSAKTKKWERYFTKYHMKYFNDNYVDVLKKYKY